MKKLAALAAAAIFATTAANAQQIVTKYSGIQPTDHPSSYAEQYFGKELATLTKGTIKVEVHHNTQLGDAVANVQTYTATVTDTGFTYRVGLEPEPGRAGDGHVFAAVPVQECRPFLVVPGAAGSGRAGQAARRQGHQGPRLSRLRRP